MADIGEDGALVAVDESRLLLVNFCRKVLEQAFNLLGFNPMAEEFLVLFLFSCIVVQE